MIIRLYRLDFLKYYDVLYIFSTLIHRNQEVFFMLLEAIECKEGCFNNNCLNYTTQMALKINQH